MYIHPKSLSQAPGLISTPAIHTKSVPLLPTVGNTPYSVRPFASYILLIFHIQFGTKSSKRFPKVTTLLHSLCYCPRPGHHPLPALLQ